MQYFVEWILGDEVNRPKMSKSNYNTGSSLKEWFFCSLTEVCIKEETFKLVFVEMHI